MLTQTLNLLQRVATYVRCQPNRECETSKIRGDLRRQPDVTSLPVSTWRASRFLLLSVFPPLFERLQAHKDTETPKKAMRRAGAAVAAVGTAAAFAQHHRRRSSGHSGKVRGAAAQEPQEETSSLPLVPAPAGAEFAADPARARCGVTRQELETTQRLRVVVVGAGVAGVTTANELLRRGHSVLLLDAAEAAAEVTSAGPAGLIRPTHVQMTNPWRIAQQFAGKQMDSLRGKTGADNPAWWLLPRVWDILFDVQSVRCIANSLVIFSRPGIEASQAKKHEQLMAHAWRSLCDVLDDFSEEYPTRLQYSSGTIDLGLSAEKAKHDAPHMVEIWEGLRLPKGDRAAEGKELVSVVSGDSVYGKEPALKSWGLSRESLGHGRVFEQGLVANCQTFTRDLLELCLERYRDQLRIGMGATVIGATTTNGVITELQTSRGPVRDFDAVVVSSGAATPKVARTCGSQSFIGVVPVKGYHLSIPRSKLPADFQIPSRAVAMLGDHLWFSPLPGELRIASIAEFSGGDVSVDQEVCATHRLVFPCHSSPPSGKKKVVDMMVDRVATAVPVLAEAVRNHARPWAGLRPATPDDFPVLGRCAAGPQNLFVLSGLGMKGFCLSFGVANMLARAIGGTDTLPDFLRPDRFW
jgi:D-amino-acid dehydrogenase